MTAPTIQVGYGTEVCGAYVAGLPGVPGPDGTVIPIVDGLCDKPTKVTVWCAFSPTLSASLCSSHYSQLEEHNPDWIDHTDTIGDI